MSFILETRKKTSKILMKTAGGWKEKRKKILA